jgi:hypothetical protein
MDVLGKILTPGMEYDGHAQPTPQAFGGCRKNLERFPSGLEQTSVYHLWMELSPAIEYMGQDKYQVIIGHRQDRLLLPLAPKPAGSLLALWAVTISTGMVQGWAYSQ